MVDLGNPGGHMSSLLQDLGLRDKTWDFQIRFSLNVFRGKFSTLLSSFSLAIKLSTPGPHWRVSCLFHSCICKYGCVLVG